MLLWSEFQPVKDWWPEPEHCSYSFRIAGGNTRSAKITFFAIELPETSRERTNIRGLVSELKWHDFLLPQLFNVNRGSGLAKWTMLLCCLYKISGFGRLQSLGTIPRPLCCQDPLRSQVTDTPEEHRRFSESVLMLWSMQDLEQVESDLLRSAAVLCQDMSSFHSVFHLIFTMDFSIHRIFDWTPGKEATRDSPRPAATGWGQRHDPCFSTCILDMKMSLDIVGHSWTINLCNLCNLCSMMQCLKIFLRLGCTAFSHFKSKNIVSGAPFGLLSQDPRLPRSSWRDFPNFSQCTINRDWTSGGLALTCSACWSFCGTPGYLILDKHLICGVKDFTPPTVTNTGTVAPTVQTVKVSARI